MSDGGRRKAARRWAMKKAELEAMLALMNLSATTLQRAFRGFVGRMAAAEARAEMAEVRTNNLYSICLKWA